MIRLLAATILLSCAAAWSADTGLNLRTYNTIAEMVEQAHPRSANKVVEVLGYHTQYDGGGGRFYATNDITTTNAFILKSAQAPTNGFARLIKAGEWVNVKMFGAKGDGVTDDYRALQAAISYTSNVYVPEGIYMVSTGLYKPGNLHFTLKGAGKERTKIMAMTNMATMLTLGTNAVPAERYEIRDIQFNGNSGLAGQAIYSPNIDHMVIDSFRATGFSTNALYLNYGWNNSITDSELSFNSGTALRLGIVGGGGGNNAFLCSNTKIFNNDGIGADIESGYGVTFFNVTFEHNAGNDILARYGIYGLNVINSYFEASCATGAAFATPSETVKVPIVINGMTGNTAQGKDFPCEGIVIDGNVYSGANSTAFIRLNAARGVRISNNRCNDDPTNPLVEVMANGDYGRAENVTVENNIGFLTQQPVLVSPAAGKPIQLSTWNITGMSGRNYMSLDPFSYAPSGTNVNLTRAEQTFNGFDVMVIDNTTAAGDTDFVLTQLDMDDYPELTNRVAYVGAWMKLGSTNMNGTAYISGIGESADFTINNGTNWHWVEMQHTLPDTGEISFGFRRYGGGTNAVFISKPVLSLVGISRDHYWLDKTPTVYRKAATPTTGYWEQGTVIWNPTVEAGSPSGWVATETGFNPGWIPIAQPNNGYLSAISSLTSTGLVVRVASDTAEVRSIVGDSEIVVTNGDGVLGNPTLAIGSGIVRTSRTISTTAPLQGGGDLSANRTFSITQAGAGSNGYLSSTDWNTFNDKVSTTRSINTSGSLTGGGNLSADRTLSLVNDNATPGNLRYYGTDSGGTKGFFALPSFTLSDGDYGDVTVGSSGTTITIDADAVTYSKMQNVSAASRLLGRGDSGSGDPQEIQLGAGLSMTGNTLSVSGGTDGETNTMSNLGGGVGVYAQKVGVDLQLNSLGGTGRISVSSNANLITISTTAELNTAANIGAGAHGPYNSKSGEELRFNSIAAGDGINVSSNANVLTFSLARTNHTFIALDNPTVTATAGENKNFWRVPYASTLKGAIALTLVASSSGSVTLDLKKNGVSILSAPVSIATGATNAVASLSGTALAVGDIITGDVDSAGTGSKGPAIQILYTTP